MLPGYAGPPARPAEIEEYYANKGTIRGVAEKVLLEHPRYIVSELTLTTDNGEAKIELYAKRKTSDELVFVFPILGGDYWFERYFANYLVRHGIDAAIILRNSEFKRPENIDRVEELFRNGVIRDRLAMDYFEQWGGKKQFGSFGISRGGINVAMTAGVDSRLKSNVIVMGGTDLVNIFRHTNQGGVAKYVDKVLAYKGYTKEQFYKYLEDTVRSEPKGLAQYVDANHTLMFISMFDRTVPATYQHQLREQIGYPETYYLASDHYLTLLYTQFVPMIPPVRSIALFPFDFIEAESMKFYRREFKMKGFTLLDVPFEILLLPSRAFFWVYDRVTARE